jgi:hypothetical protein
MWPWTRIVVWHGDASDGESVAVHYACGMAAGAEFSRGLRFPATTGEDAHG